MTSPLAPPSASMTREQVAQSIERSRAAMDRFIRHQEEWSARAKNAFQDGFAIEAIGICIPQLHAMLRRGLWIRSQLLSLEQHPDVWNDEYSFELLLQGRNDTMEGVPDQQLYGAALRFGVIGAHTAGQLHRLYEDAKVTLRAIFSVNAREKEHPTLEQIAAEFLEVEALCIETLKSEFAAFDQKINGLLEKLKE